MIAWSALQICALGCYLVALSSQAGQVRPSNRLVTDPSLKTS
jgi:hypothetical protein